MIGVEQWRASIGLFHSGSHRQLACTAGEKQLLLTTICQLLAIIVLALIPTDQLTSDALIISQILVSGYSSQKGELAHIAFKKKTSSTQLPVLAVCAIGLVVILEVTSGSLERSIRAMAILLIMAEDVEENPGPLPPICVSPESRALRHHFASLVTAIADPLMLSLKLFSAGIIEKTTKDKSNLPKTIIEEKNDVLLSAVLSKVDTDPSLFHRFVNLLKNDGDDILKSLGGKLEDTYNKFAGDTEQCTLNRRTLKQSRLLSNHNGKQYSQLYLRALPRHLQTSQSHHSSQPLSPSNLDPYHFEESHFLHSLPCPLHPLSSQSVPQLSQPLPRPSQFISQLTRPHPLHSAASSLHSTSQLSQPLSFHSATSSSHSTSQLSQPPPPHLAAGSSYSLPRPLHSRRRSTQSISQFSQARLTAGSSQSLPRAPHSHSSKCNSQPHLQYSQPHSQPSQHPQPLQSHSRLSTQSSHSHPRPEQYYSQPLQLSQSHPQLSQPHPRPPQPSQSHPQPSQAHPQPPQPHSRPSHPHPGPPQPSQPYPGPPQPSQPHPQPSQPHTRLSQPSQPHPQSTQPSQPHSGPPEPSPHSFCPCPCFGVQPSQPPTHPQSSQSHPHIPPLIRQMCPPPTKMEHSPPPPVKCSPPPPLAMPSPPPSFFHFVSYLRSFFNSEVPLSYCKWPPVPRKKYINLAAISREKVSSEELKQFMLATLHGNVDQILETKAPIKIQDILDKKAEETLHSVLVEGTPGVGKTTLSWEICKQWARRELFQQFSAILFLKLRDRTVQNAKNIIDLVYYMYDDEDDEGFRIDISQYMKQTKGRNILIILEGLDELPKHLLNLEQPSIFTRLLSRKILPDATILITSRPSATVQLRQGWEISRHIEVLGFTEENITDYIQGTLSPQELPAFDNYLSTYPNIRLAMYIPLNCAIVVEVYRSCQQSSHPPPKTTTELYTRLVQTILLRYLDSHPDYKEDTTDVDEFTDLPAPVYQHFYKLIRMAYDGVQSQQLTFHDQHRVIEHLGFMDTVTELFPSKRSVTYSYNFLHLGLQEYLAAYYLSLKSTAVQQQVLRTICNKQHLRNMGRFLAGITKYDGMERATIKAIIEHECKKKKDGSLILSPYTLQLLHESGDYSIIDGHPSYTCSLTDYSPLLDFAVLGYCIANSSYKWRLTLGDARQYMQSTDRIAMLVQTLRNHSNSKYTIELITCYYNAPECVQHLLELPEHALQQVQTLGLWSNSENPHSLSLPQCVLKNILSKMSRLEWLELWNGAVSTSGAIAMTKFIKNNNTLRQVYLYNNNIGDEGTRALHKIRETKKDLKLNIL